MTMDLEEINRKFHQNPFDAYSEFWIQEVHATGKAVLTFLPKKERFANGKGIMHGGALYALADSAMGVACFGMGKEVVSLDLSMNYLSVVRTDQLVTATAQVIHNGKKTMVCTCDFYDENGRHLGFGKGTFFVIGPKEGER